MSARVSPGHFAADDDFCQVSCASAHAVAERASQPTATSAGDPVPPDRGVAAATRAFWLGDCTGRVSGVAQGRPAVRAGRRLL